MARTVGAKNKNTGSMTFSHDFRTHWGNPEKLDMINEELEAVLIDGGFRDKISAITLILKYCAVPLEKEVESDTAIHTAEMSKVDILAAIKDLKG